MEKALDNLSWHSLGVLCLMVILKLMVMKAVFDFDEICAQKSGIPCFISATHSPKCFKTKEINLM